MTMERIEMRAWALASLALCFFVAFCISIAPKPTSTRVGDDPLLLLSATK